MANEQLENNLPPEDINALLAEASNVEGDMQGFEGYYDNFDNLAPPTPPAPPLQDYNEYDDPYSGYPDAQDEYDDLGFVMQGADTNQFAEQTQENATLLQTDNTKENTMADNDNAVPLTPEEQHELMLKTFKNVTRDSVPVSDMQKYTNGTSSALDDRLDEVGKFLNPSLSDTTANMSNEQRFEVLSSVTSAYIKNASSDIKPNLPADEVKNYLQRVDSDGNRLRGLVKAELVSDGQVQDLSFNLKQPKYSFDNFSSLTNNEKGLLKDTIYRLPPSLANEINDGMAELQSQFPANQFKFEYAYEFVLQKGSEYDNMVNNMLPENRSKANKDKTILSNVVGDIDNNTTRYLHDNDISLEVQSFTPRTAEEYSEYIQEKVEGLNKQLNSFEQNKSRPKLDTADTKELDLLLDKVAEVDYFNSNDVMMARIEDRLSKTNANLDSLGVPEHMKVALLNHDLSQVGYSTAVEQFSEYNNQNPDNKKSFGKEISEDYRNAQREVNKNQYLESSNAEPYTSTNNTPISDLKGLSKAESAILNSSLHSLSHGARTHVYDELRKEFKEGDETSYTEVLSKVTTTLTDFDDLYKEVSVGELSKTKTSYQSFKKAVDTNVDKIANSLDNDEKKLELKNKTTIGIKDGVDSSAKNQGNDIKNKDWGTPTNSSGDGSTTQNPEAFKENKAQSPKDAPEKEGDSPTVKNSDQQKKNPKPIPKAKKKGGSDSEQEDEELNEDEELKQGFGLRGGRDRQRGGRNQQQGNPQQDGPQLNQNGSKQSVHNYGTSYSLFNVTGNKGQPNNTPNQSPPADANSLAANNAEGGENCPPLEECDRRALQQMAQEEGGLLPFGSDTLPPIHADEVSETRSKKPKVDFGNNSLNDGYLGLDKQRQRMRDYFNSDSYNTAEGFKMAEEYLSQAEKFSKEVGTELESNSGNAERVNSINDGIKSVDEINNEVTDLIKEKGLDNPDLPQNKKRAEKMKENLGEAFDKVKEGFSDIAEKAKQMLDAIKNTLGRVFK